MTHATNALSVPHDISPAIPDETRVVLCGSEGDARGILSGIGGPGPWIIVCGRPDKLYVVPDTSFPVERLRYHVTTPASALKAIGAATRAGNINYCLVFDGFEKEMEISHAVGSLAIVHFAAIVGASEEFINDVERVGIDYGMSRSPPWILDMRPKAPAPSFS